MNARTTALLAALSAPALAAHGAITGVTGSTFWLGSPPLACGPGQLQWSNGFVSAWDEQQNRPQTLSVDMTNNPGTSGSATPGVLSGVYDSHFIHFEGIPGIVNATGSVTFSSTIVGVIFTPTNLDNSDVPCGSLGTVYPTTYPFRGLNSTPQSAFSINGNTLTFSLWAIQPTSQIDQIRVLTIAPTPGALALVGLGGLLAARRRR
jgi:hypothetical protein